MTTTIQVGDDNKEALESLIEEHGLRSKNEAVSFLRQKSRQADSATEEIDSLTQQVDRLESKLEQTPPSHEQHTQIYDAFNMDWSLSIPRDMASVLLTEADTDHIFGLFESDSPYLYDKEAIERTMVLSLYALQSSSQSYLLVYHKLSEPHNPRAAFAVKSEYYEDEVINIVESSKWATEPDGLSHRTQVNGRVQPTFGGIGRPATDDEQTKVYGLTDVASLITSETDETDSEALITSLVTHYQAL